MISDQGLAQLKKLADLPRTRRSSSADHVADVLRDAVMTGLFPPGMTLRQEELAAVLGLSRMPVREAIRLLDAQGLVEFLPHRGAVVASISAEEAEEVFEVRAALEGLAIRRSVPRFTSHSFAIASDILEEMESTRDPVAYFGLHRRFHLALYANGCSQRFLASLNREFDIAERYLRLEQAETQNDAEDREEHRALLAAYHERDVEAAVRIIIAHISEAGQGLAARLRARAIHSRGEGK